MSSAEGGYLERLAAQAAYQLLRRGSWANVQDWFHGAYPETRQSYIDTVRQQAEALADNTRRFRDLAPGDTFAVLTGHAFYETETFEMVLNVGIPQEGGRVFWTNVRVTFTDTWTKKEIEDAALAVAAERAGMYNYGGRSIPGEIEEPVVNLLRGLPL